MSSVWILAPILVAFLLFPILGNLRPDLVSFLPSMRQYAGNWASALWAFRGDEAENKLNENLTKFNDNQIDQLSGAFGKEVAEIFMQKAVAWRTMHSQGRGLMSLMMRHLDKLENYRIREGEFTCTTLVAGSSATVTCTTSRPSARCRNGAGSNRENASSCGSSPSRSIGRRWITR